MTLNSRNIYCGMLYSAMGSTTKYWYLADRSLGQYWWHFSWKRTSMVNCWVQFLWTIFGYWLHDILTLIMPKKQTIKFASPQKFLKCFIKTTTYPKSKHWRANSVDPDGGSSWAASAGSTLFGLKRLKFNFSALKVKLMHTSGTAISCWYTFQMIKIHQISHYQHDFLSYLLGKIYTNFFT